MAGAARLDTFPHEKNERTGGRGAVAKEQHTGASILQYSINALLKCPTDTGAGARAKKKPAVAAG
jgi:hypothetical protein